MLPAFALPAQGHSSLNSLSATTPGLSQSIVEVGSGDFTLTLRGSGFSPTSVARLVTTNLVTTFVDSTNLKDG
jgi:hypothetical protein